ncbi:hypothetical protein RND81_12G116800 [Saponaria officinalis]|uniref:Uncharacterized protein n=1 Tax=Saponaria officinalis TaxID=3572 RepID=A0AAW1H9H0_SAPOF
MVAPSTKLTIPFCPLLQHITDSLKFPCPIYQVLDEAHNSAVVSVKTYCGPISYSYVGGPELTLADSCEKAAQRAVRDLMTKFGVVVEDITLNKRLALQQCADYYRLKSIALEKLETSIPTHTPCVTTNNPPNPKISVSVDYMSVLRTIYRNCKISSTPVETVEHSSGVYTSWMTITAPNQFPLGTCIFSDRCGDLVKAKNSLAKKAIEYLMPLYGIEIVDANYNPEADRYAAVACALERETYLTLKERVFGIIEEVKPSCLLVESDCATPRSRPFQIPAINSPPLPPKKRKNREASGSQSFVPAHPNGPLVFFKVPPSLETVISRTKKCVP